ncbi:hypothetical protein D039_0920A, partial [Vibrio parahaemolyticus EKP-028]
MSSSAHRLLLSSIG